MVRGVTASYGRWLFWNRECGQLTDNVKPESLAVIERVQAFVSHLQASGNKPATIRHRLMGLERMLAVIAPRFDRTALKSIKSEFSKSGDRRAKRARIQDADVLVKFAEVLASDAEADASRDLVRSAVRYRDALQIMLLAYRPMRLKNFASLRIGHELVCQEGQWTLDIPKSATKRGNAYDPIVPTRVVKYLDRYVTYYRKELAKSQYTGDAFWVSFVATPQAENSIRHQVSRLTSFRFGQSMTPHLFRDAAATTIATQIPETIRMAPLILGNRGQESIEVHYNLALRADADLRYNAGLDAFESDGEAPKAKKQAPS